MVRLSNSEFSLSSSFVFSCWDCFKLALLKLETLSLVCYIYSRLSSFYSNFTFPNEIYWMFGRFLSKVPDILLYCFFTLSFYYGEGKLRPFFGVFWFRLPAGVPALKLIFFLSIVWGDSILPIYELGPYGDLSIGLHFLMITVVRLCYSGEAFELLTELLSSTST